MLFRQLFDPSTSTFSYLLADDATGEAVILDPVREQVERDIRLIEELGIHLIAALETHVHADHVTGGGLLRERLRCRLLVGERTGVTTADAWLAHGEQVPFGSHCLEVRATPGHTEGCVSYVCHREHMAFTGDALLVRGCGRTDFQQGDAATLYASVLTQILGLPDETLLYPGHDYRGFGVTTVAEEKRFNPRLGNGMTAQQFVEFMGKLDLPFPRRIDEAVPANLNSGIGAPESIPPVSPASVERSCEDATFGYGAGI